MSRKKRHGSNSRKKLKPEKKKIRLFTRKTIVAAACCVAVVLCAAAVVLLLRANQKLPVASVGGHTVGQAELQYYYVEAISDYQDQVSRYGSEYENGIDFTQTLSQQSCPLTSGISWHTYFLQKALDNIRWEVAAQQEAQAAGFALSGAQTDAVQLGMDHLKAVAEEAGMSLEEYLLERYGKNVTEELIETLLERKAVSTFYLASLTEEYTPAEEEIETYFQENRRWNMLADYWAVPLDAGVEEQEQILTDLEGAGEAEDFLTRCEAYMDTPSADRAVLHEDTSASGMEDYTVAEWLLDDSRQAGDATVVESYDETTNQKSLIALYFLGARRNDRPTYRFQEILLMPEAVQPGDTAQYWGKKQVEEISALTDGEEFGVMAAMFSSLNSGEQLGIRTAGAEELSGQPYAQWLEDESRTAGEVGTFETDYGVYLVRYIGPGEVYWESNAVNDLISQKEDQWQEDAGAAVTVDTNLFYTLIQ